VDFSGQISQFNQNQSSVEFLNIRLISTM
jgi:hypothetical protein